MAAGLTRGSRSAITPPPSTHARSHGTFHSGPRWPRGDSFWPAAATGWADPNESALERDSDPCIKNFQYFKNISEFKLLSPRLHGMFVTER